MKLYGILAYPAGHSLSPAVHNAAFKELEIDAKYEVFEIPEKELDSFMARVKIGEISGLSVSLPYKERIIKFLDSIDENSRNIGAVNTIVNKNGLLYGYNTDFLGSNRALKETLGDVNGMKVVVLGAGGASRAICYGLLRELCEVSVLNRDKGKAEKLALELRKFGKIEGTGLDRKMNFKGKLLIQASSIWTLNKRISQKEIDDFIPDEFVNQFEAVMDAVYTPIKTPLILKAEKLGKTIITGNKMFLYQAAAQFELWTGKEFSSAIFHANI